jgi:undecaprenyl-diphosphatase
MYAPADGCTADFLLLCETETEGTYQHEGCVYYRTGAGLCGNAGSTIATGLILGNKKETLAQFSFLMVIPPILGEALLDGMKIIKDASAVSAGISTASLVVGFLAAFVSGCIACKWMINIVKKGKLIWFGVYCAIVGIITIVTSLLS